MTASRQNSALSRPGARVSRTVEKRGAAEERERHLLERAKWFWETTDLVPEEVGQLIASDVLKPTGIHASLRPPSRKALNDLCKTLSEARMRVSWSVGDRASGVAGTVRALSYSAEGLRELIARRIHELQPNLLMSPDSPYVQHCMTRQELLRQLLEHLTDVCNAEIRPSEEFSEAMPKGWRDIAQECAKAFRDAIKESNPNMKRQLGNDVAARFVARVMPLLIGEETTEDAVRMHLTRRARKRLRTKANVAC
jgi:hypothetical protein